MENTETTTEKMVIRIDGTIKVIITTTVKAVFNGDENEAVEHHNATLAAHISSQSPACGGAGSAPEEEIGRSRNNPFEEDESGSDFGVLQLDGRNTLIVIGKDSRKTFSAIHFEMFDGLMFLYDAKQRVMKLSKDGTNRVLALLKHCGFETNITCCSAITKKNNKVGASGGSAGVPTKKMNFGFDGKDADITINADTREPMIFAEGRQMVFDFVRHTCDGLTFRGTDGTWVMKHPKAIERTLRTLRDHDIHLNNKGVWKSR